MSATAIWIRTAFSEVPRKWLIFKVCLTHRKNSSMAQRRLYKSAISCALALRSLVKMRNTLPVSITTLISRTSFDIGFLREAASRCGRCPVRSLRIDDPAATGRSSTAANGVLALSRVTIRQPHHEIQWLVGVGIVDDVRFGAANSRRERRPIAAQAAQLHAGRIDQTHTIADLAAISALQLSHQRRKQAGEDRERTRRISGRKRTARNRAAAKMMKLGGMALQARLDIAQSSCIAKLRVKHRDQVRPGLQPARIPLRFVLFHKPVEHGPRNMLQNSMKNDILMLHGVDPFSCPVDSQTPGTE